MPHVQSAARRCVVRAGLLLDGTTRPPLPQPAIVIEGERIAAVLAGELPAESDAQILDFGDAVITPGLIECHLHLVGDPVIPTHQWCEMPADALIEKARSHAAQALRAGVTTLRDCGGPQALIFELRDAIAHGELQGPRIVAAGRVVTIPGGHGHFMGIETRGPQAAAETVEQLIAAGADFIKVIASGGGGTPGTYPWDSQFSVEELAAMVQAAHRAGRRVGAHAHSVAAIRNCLDAGIDTFEHVTFITANGPRLQPDLVRRLADAGVFVIPTIACYRNPVQAGLPKPFIQKIGMAGMDFVELHQSHVRQMLDAGVRLAAGTDGVQVGVGPAAVPDEARYLAEVAGSPAFGLRAATSLAAQALGVEADCGTVEAGKRADLLILRRNPLEDMAALRDVAGVIKDGKLVA